MNASISLLRTKGSENALINAQLLIWESAGLQNIDEFPPVADKRLVEIVSSLPEKTRLYIDFRNVNRFASKTLQSVLGVAGKDWHRRIFLVSDDESITSHLTRSQEYKKTGNKLFYRNQAVQIVNKLPPSITLIETTFIEKSLRKAFRRNKNNRNEKLRSSLIWANGVFDAGRVIRDAQQFGWCALLLSRRVRAIVEDVDQSGSSAALPYPVKLVSGSLRGGVFAAAVAHLSGPTIEYVAIDHLGPVHRVGERPRRITDFPTDSPIIVVADFVSGGTEIKMTRSYLEWHNWRMLGAVALGIMWPADIYSEFCGIIKPLVCLSKLVPSVRVSLPGRTKRK